MKGVLCYNYQGKLSSFWSSRAIVTLTQGTERDFQY